MGHKVSVELATRAIVKLDRLPADVQQAMQRRIVWLSREIGKQVDATGALASPALIPRLVRLDRSHERIYRLLFGLRGVDYYITFRWPRHSSSESRTVSVMIVLSVGNWDEKFRAWCNQRQREL